MGCQKKDQDQKTQTVAKNVSLICCPDGLVDSTGRRGSSAGRLSFGRRPLELETDNHHEENHDGGSFCWMGDRDGPDYCDYLKLDVNVLELEMEGKLQPP